MRPLFNYHGFKNRTGPIGPLVGHGSSPVQSIRPKSGIGPFEPAVRLTNQAVPSRPSSSFSFLLSCVAGTPIVAWSVVRHLHCRLERHPAGRTPDTGNLAPKTLQIPSSRWQHLTPPPLLQSPITSPPPTAHWRSSPSLPSLLDDWKSGTPHPF